MGTNEDKIRHLEMIQNVITRMGSNSFVVKGWSVLGIGGLFAYWISDRERIYMLWLILVVTVLFWLHDAYYLALERGFRNFYDKVRLDDNEKTDFEIKSINVEHTITVAFDRPVLYRTYGAISMVTIVLIILNCIA